MTDDDIAKARAVIAAASKGPASWTADTTETEAEAFARLRLAFEGARAITGSAALHTVEVDRNDDGSCLVMAITGNGPQAPANAKYIASSLDPVAGWSAALDEVERLRSERTSDIEMWRATESDLALNHRRADEAEAQVERLTKLHALAESALSSAHDATKALLALADRYFEAKEPLEVVADAARAFVAALDRDSDLVDEIRRLRSTLAGAPVPPEVAKLVDVDRAPAELPYSESVAARIDLGADA